MSCEPMCEISWDCNCQGGCEGCMNTAETCGQACCQSFCEQCDSCQSGECGSCESGEAPSTSNINISAVGKDYIKVYPDGVSGATEYKWYLNGAYMTSTTSIIDMVSFNSLEQNTTYTVGLRACNSNGCSSMTTRDITTASRPPFFSFTTPIIQGEEINLSASDFNNLRNNIQDVRVYMGFGFATIRVASANEDIPSSDFNQARNAINAMSPPISPPSTKLGISDVENPFNADDIAADDWNLLVDSLNSIS